MRCFKNILTIVVTYLLILSISGPTNVYGKTTGEILVMERLKTIQEYVQVMKNEICEIKSMEEEKLVAEGKSIQLDLELVALVVKSGISEKGSKVTINSEGTKTVEITDINYKEEIDELVSDENVEKFIVMADKIHNVFLHGKEKRQAITDIENRETIESILNTMHSVICDMDFTIEKQNYDLNMMREKSSLHKVKEEYAYIREYYSNSNGEELISLVNRAIGLKDFVFSFAMDLVDKVVV